MTYIVIDEFNRKNLQLDLDGNSFDKVSAGEKFEDGQLSGTCVCILTNVSCQFHNLFFSVKLGYINMLPALQFRQNGTL